MDNQESSDYISMSQKPYRRVVIPRKIEMDVPEVICKPYVEEYEAAMKRYNGLL